MDNVVALDEGRSGLVGGCPRAITRLAIVLGLAIGGWLALTLLSSAAHADSIADLTDHAASRTTASAPVRALDQLVDLKDADDTAVDRPLTSVTATVGKVVKPVGETVGLVTSSLPALDLAPAKAAIPVHTGHAKHHITVVTHHAQPAPRVALPVAIAPQQPRTTAPISLPAPQPASSGLPDLAPSTAPVGAAHSGAGTAVVAMPAQRPEVAAPAGLAQPRPAGSWRVRNAALDPSVSPD
ncbi:hypothetical protein [Fodinicola acaciae]|uniref:hypothetical protein n=1 Tax=Fodinicola acaciae TaxID=2681555 RepID=UPI0013D87EE6|nr:hypothetical protein [Fodinicola acaciae]